MCVYLNSGQNIVGSNGLSFIFPRKIVGTGRQINNENTRGSGKRGGGILADIGRRRQRILEDSSDACQRRFKVNGRGKGFITLFGLFGCAGGTHCNSLYGILGQTNTTTTTQSRGKLDFRVFTVKYHTRHTWSMSRECRMTKILWKRLERQSCTFKAATNRSSSQLQRSSYTSQSASWAAHHQLKYVIFRIGQW